MTRHQVKGVNQSKTFSGLILHLRDVILNARFAASRNVNTLQVLTNYLIGKAIVEYEQQGKVKAAYGKKQLKKVSRKLTKEFGRGYSADNLELMRKFYLTYQFRMGIDALSISGTVTRKFKKSSSSLALSSSSPISETLSRISSREKHLLQITWSHFVLLMKMDEPERRFYEIETAVNNWSIRELERQYNSSLYKRLVLSRDKKKVKQLSRRGQILQRPDDLLRQPYILEFLGLKEETAYTENELETAIINRVEHFMLEMGKGFLFEARQKRIHLQGDDYFIDQVFYNRLLRCFVLIDLKIGKLTHKDIGQMQMYANYFDRRIKQKAENNTIGIVLCKQSNHAAVEFTLPEKQKQIFAREYKLYLPGKEELKKQIQNL